MKEIEPAPATAWLSEWIGHQLRFGSVLRTELSAAQQDAIYLYASLGAETALTATGEVWIGEYDIEAFESATKSIRWRRAEGVERLGCLVIAARRFPALQALLPLRPAGAPPCASCRGTGSWHIFSSDGKAALRIPEIICKACGGLGWRPPPAG